MEILKNPNFDFLGRTKIFVVISLLIIISGAVLMQRNGIRYGVEFSGGTQLIVRFRQAPHIDRVRTAVWKTSPGATIQIYDEAAKNQVLIRIAGTEEGDLTAPAQRVLRSLAESYGDNPILD